MCAVDTADVTCNDNEAFSQSHIAHTPKNLPTPQRKRNGSKTFLSPR